MVRALVGDSTITSVDIVLDVLDQQLETDLSEMGFRVRQAMNYAAVCGCNKIASALASALASKVTSKLA
jgi:hypothetical protein